MVTKFTNVSNLAAFGVEWTADETGSLYQLVNPRGRMLLTFSVKTSPARGWSTVVVVNPSRFMDTPPTTFAQFARVASAFVNA